MYINSRMNKQVLIYLHTAILLSNKKKHTVGSNAMDESQKQWSQVKEALYKRECTWWFYFCESLGQAKLTHKGTKEEKWLGVVARIDKGLEEVWVIQEHIICKT